jgi:thiol:disulfide interchange protein DsbD
MKYILTLLLFFNSLFALGQSGGSFLPADEAFKISSKVENSSVIVTIKLADKIHIYDEELKFKVIKPIKLDLTKDAIKPKAHKDSMGSMVYNHNIQVKLPLSKINQKNFTLEVSLMGCSDKGLCYPPVTKTFNLKANLSAKKSVEKKELSEEGKIVDTLKHGSLFTILGLFFGFGLLLSLTPCIFPMIPILSSIIVNSSKGKEITMGRGIFLSLIYIISMSVAYTIAGVIA